MEKLMEYLKTQNSSTLLNCTSIENPGESDDNTWVPVIENNTANGAFLTKTPEEIYNDPTEEAPAVDTMFSFTSLVLQAYSSYDFYKCE